MADISTHHAEQLAIAHRRLDAHDSRINKIEVSAAGEAVRSQNIEEALTEIKSGITWITRLVIGGIIAGIITFALAGGFNVG